MFPAVDAAERRACLEENRRAVDEAATLPLASPTTIESGVCGRIDLPHTSASEREGLAWYVGERVGVRAGAAALPLIES
jgi:hypothetical protein